MAKSDVDGQDKDDRVLAKYIRIEGVTSVLNNLIRWGGLTAIAYFAYRSIDTLAGRTTLADMGVSVSFFTGARIADLMAWVLAVVGVGYGLAQRSLRGRTVARQEGRVIALETKIDPERTSSRLTRRGKTRPEDKL